MNDKTLCAVYLDDEKATEELGQIIGRVLFKPLVKNKKRSVVCAYGPYKSGKSTLFNAARAACEEDPTVFGPMPLRDGKIIEREDFGGKGTYPNSKGAYTAMYKFGVEPVDKTVDAPKVCYYEHSPIPHLKDGDIGLVFNWPSGDQEFYLKALSSEIKDCAKRLGLTEGPAMKVVEQMEKANVENCTRRSVRIFLLSDDEAHRTAFRNLTRVVEKKFPGCDVA
jgi:energy-coupling factor transporter ATP-binding protein EcfA2